jgi:hypothetical protein
MFPPSVTDDFILFCTGRHRYRHHVFPPTVTDDFCYLCCSIAQDALLFVIITDVLFLFFSLHRAPSLTSSVSSFHNGQFFHSEETVFQSSQIDGKFLRSDVHVLRSNSTDGLDYGDDRGFGNSSDEDAGSSRQKF